MSETAQANDGAQLPLFSLPVEIVYAGGYVESMTVNYAGNQYIQTFQNDGTNITYISGWNNPNFPPTESIMADESGGEMITEDGSLMIMQ